MPTSPPRPGAPPTPCGFPFWLRFPFLLLFFPPRWSSPAFLSRPLFSSSGFLLGVHRAWQMRFPQRPAEGDAAPPAGPHCCARASCEVRWEEAAWEPRPEDGAGARSRTCRWVSGPRAWESGGLSFSCRGPGFKAGLSGLGSAVSPEPAARSSSRPGSTPPPPSVGAPRTGSAHSPPREAG